MQYQNKNKQTKSESASKIEFLFTHQLATLAHTLLCLDQCRFNFGMFGIRLNLICRMSLDWFLLKERIFENVKLKMYGSKLRWI